MQDLFQNLTTVKFRLYHFATLVETSKTKRLGEEFVSDAVDYLGSNRPHLLAYLEKDGPHSSHQYRY